MSQASPPLPDQREPREPRGGGEGERASVFWDSEDFPGGSSLDERRSKAVIATESDDAVAKVAGATRLTANSPIPLAVRLSGMKIMV